MTAPVVIIPGLRDQTARVRVGDVLVATGVVSREDMAAALRLQQQRPGSRPGNLLDEMGLATGHEVAEALAVVHGLHQFQLDENDHCDAAARTWWVR